MAEPARHLIVSRRFLPRLLSLILLGLLLASASCSRDNHRGTDQHSAARARIVALNLASPAILPAAVVDSLLTAEAELPVAERIGRWARRFLDEPRAEYRFGLAEGGYVTEGLIVDDRHHDCVSLLYRTSELARAVDHGDALDVALATRFAGAPVDSLADAAGRVDYDRPEHLDFSLEMVRSGHWGSDITATLSGAVRDSAGSARYRAGSFVYVPTGALLPAALREGDVVWLVLDPTHPGARRLRDEHGLVIGHIGLVIVVDTERRLVHAARSALPGWYSGGRVEQVPLMVYLERVDRFAGVIVTRF